MREGLDRAVTSTQLSYRALFTWLNPYGYVSSRIVMPLGIALLFASISQYHSGDAVRPVVGGALLAIAISPLFGMALSVGNERQFGTLGLWLAAPEGLMSNLAGKVSVHVFDGLLGAILTFVVSAAVFDIGIAADQVPLLLLCAATVMFSSAGAALVVGAAVFRWRDTFTPPSVAMQTILVCSGVMVPLSALPGGFETVAHVIPLSHAVAAALALLQTGHLDYAELGKELLVGLGWGSIGYFALLRSIRRLRRTGGIGLV